MNATILCYHKVGPESEEGRKLNIEPGRLASHVRFFARRAGHIVLARDLGSAWEPGTVCFTFDDAYQSTMTFVPPILERYGVVASFYAVGGRIGGRSDWDGTFSRPLANWGALADAQAAGHEIGNHSMNHHHLSLLTAAQQLAEVRGADHVLRDRGLYPGSFCFPYGSFDAATLEALSTCGYPVGLALGKRLADEKEDRRSLGRIPIAFSDALPMLLYRLYLRPRLRR